MSKKVTIILVDDHAVVRAGVRRLLEQEALFDVIGEAESGEKAYHMFGELKPDVMVMDLSMPGMGGLGGLFGGGMPQPGYRNQPQKKVKKAKKKRGFADL